jgi:hypothetical protein
VKRELQYVLGMFQYVVERIKSSSSVNTARTSRRLGANMKEDDDCTSSTNSCKVTGTFLNLHCGHNVAYSDEERKQLQEFISIFIQESSTTTTTTLSDTTSTTSATSTSLSTLSSHEIC